MEFLENGLHLLHEVNFKYKLIFINLNWSHESVFVLVYQGISKNKRLAESTTHMHLSSFMADAWWVLPILLLTKNLNYPEHHLNHQVVLDDTGRVLALGFLIIIACLVQILRSSGWDNYLNCHLRKCTDLPFLYIFLLKWKSRVFGTFARFFMSDCVHSLCCVNATMVNLQE